MSKIAICDLCKLELPNGLPDTNYKVTVKRRWWGYDGFQPYYYRSKLEVCSTCMKKLISSAKESKSRTKLEGEHKTERSDRELVPKPQSKSNNKDT
jgi:hypothetical protein